MGNKTSSINLAKKKEKNFVEKFLQWSLTIGRLLVIVTEVIALSAFLYRFVLDRQIIDLHDQIRQKQQIVKFLKPNEDKFRSIQTRLASSSKLASQGAKTTKIFTDILGFKPPDLTFNNLAVSVDLLRIEANVQTIGSLTQFVNSLKKYPQVSSISIDKIENKASNATITVNISAVLKTKP